MGETHSLPICMNSSNMNCVCNVKIYYISFTVGLDISHLMRTLSESDYIEHQIFLQFWPIYQELLDYRTHDFYTLTG